MGIENLNGKIIDYIGNPISDVNISIFRKVGEVLSNEDGDYNNIEYNESNNYIVKCSKIGYFDSYVDYPINDILNVTLFKNDNFLEPTLPDSIQVIDYQTGDSVLISWTEVDFEFIAGYNIYRSNSLQGTYEKINENIIISNSYIDSEIEVFTEYFYILEVVSANSPFIYGAISRSSIMGPIIIKPISEMNDITDFVYKIKVDSTKTNMEVEKVFDKNDNTWWESQRGKDAWIELIFEERKNINGFYFKKASISKGIIYGRLQYWNYNLENWVDIEKLDFMVVIDYTFKNFIVNTDRIRLYIDDVEALTEAQISEIVIYGE